MPDIQSIAALVIVLATAVIFVARSFQNTKGSCGGGCGCPVGTRVKSGK